MNALGAVTVKPSDVVSTIFLAPELLAGVRAVTCVAVATTLVDSYPPMVTLTTLARLVPVMVIALAPTSGPAFGLINAKVGSDVL